MKSISLISKSVYGTIRYYPACEFSNLLCELLGRKTITGQERDVLKRHGYDITYVNEVTED